MLLGAQWLFSAPEPVKPALPYDAEVEYLESTGTQWIDTGYYPDPVNFGVEIDSIFINDLPGTRSANGCWGPNWGGSNFIFSINGNFLGRLGCIYRNWRADQNNLIGIVRQYGVRSVVRAETLRDGTASSHTVRLTQDGVSTDYEFNDVYPQKATATFIVFAIRGGSSGFRPVENAHFILYGLKILEFGNVVMDFIPVRFTNELGQSEGAMYDRVSGRLFRNQGTGAFLYGADVYRVPSTIGQYVRNGLVAMWDGIENAGVGMRCDSPSTWKDLAGTNAAQISSMTTEENAFRTAYKGNATFSMPTLQSSDYTIELVSKLNGFTAIDTRIFFNGNDKCYSTVTSTSALQYAGRAGSDASILFSNDDKYDKKYITWSIDSSNISLYNDGTFYRNGSSPPTLPSTYSFPPQLATQYIDASMYSLRIYDRTLTPTEISANHQVDL